jgi:transcriptional regulator GlxA family with amidase domain
MRRRGFLSGVAGLTVATAARGWTADAAAGKLTPPAKGPLKIAFVISNDATLIDFCGPWEVFGDVAVDGRDGDACRLYTVADSAVAVKVSGGMQIVPDFTVHNAPEPHVVVVPALRASPAMLEWLKQKSASADLVMSVCTGAFTLAKAGLLRGGPATTHHLFFDRFAQQFPDVELRRGKRFVERERLATAGGLTSGIDLALRVVERYFGRPVALRTAEYMEYESRAWVV